MSRDDVRAELDQAKTALATVAEQFTQSPEHAGAAGDPLGALYFAVHHLYRAVEKLAGESGASQKGA